MAASSLGKDLEEELKEAGNRLLMPPSSVDELLNLLDKVECLLSKVEQEPSRSMQDALLPPMKALIANELLRHCDTDVKVSVASCISELTRITAPDAPYNDEHMKEIFQLTIMAFEKLSSVSDRCHSKAIQILDSVAKVRSCLLMLDLECDSLIVGMFQQFLNTIRSNHPQAVFSDMETIMTLVIDESAVPSFELLSLLLSSVKKENQKGLPLPWKLGEKVLRNCAAKLKLYLPEVVKYTNLAFDSYAEVVASICQDASGKEHLVAEGLPQDAICFGEIGPSVDRLSKSVIDDGTTQTRNDGTLENETFFKTLKRCQQTKQQKSTDAVTDPTPEHLDATKTVQPVTDPDITAKRGRKTNSLEKPEDGYDHSGISRGRKSTEMPRRRKNYKKETGNATKSSTSKGLTLPPELEKETNYQIFSPKASHSGSLSASASQNHTFPDGSHRRKGRLKKKEFIITQYGDLDLLLAPEEDLLRARVKEQASLSADVALKEESEGVRHSEPKNRRGLRENEVAGKITVERTPSMRNVIVKKEDGVLSDHERQQESLVRQIDYKKQSRGETSSVEHVTAESGDKNSGMPCGIKEYGDELVGCRIKVWWPLDLVFYEGTISSFDPSQKKHKILYIDSDEEILDLSMEHWKMLGNMSPDREQDADLPSPDALSDKPSRKKKAKTKLSSVKQDNIVSLAKSTSADGSTLDHLCIADKTKDDATEIGHRLKDGGQKSTGEPETETPMTLIKRKRDTACIVIKSNGFHPKVESEPRSSSKATVKNRSSQEELSGVVGKGKLPDSVNALDSKTRTGKKKQGRVKN